MENIIDLTLEDGPSAPPPLVRWKDHDPQQQMLATRSRSWCFTLSNYGEGDEVFLMSCDDWSYVIYGKERAPTTGTPHLQGFFYFKSPLTRKSVKERVGPRYHLEIANDPERAILYCRKGSQTSENWKKFGSSSPNFGLDADVHEAGPPPVFNVVSRGVKGKDHGVKGKDYGELGGAIGGKAEQDRWQLALEHAQKAEYDCIDPQIQIMHGNKLEGIHARWMRKQNIANTFEVNEWIFGESGTGKSRSVRDRFPFPTIYVKMLNKWWDGYDQFHDNMKGQTVLIEDVDPIQCQRLAHFMKTWADHFPFPCEVKGIVTLIRPLRIIVTSQYTIDQCFNSEDAIALKRRFVVKRQEKYGKPPVVVNNDFFQKSAFWNGTSSDLKLGDGVSSYRYDNGITTIKHVDGSETVKLPPPLHADATQDIYDNDSFEVCNGSPSHIGFVERCSTPAPSPLKRQKPCVPTFYQPDPVVNDSEDDEEEL